MKKKFLKIIFLSFCFTAPLFAAHSEIHLTVGYKTVSFAGKIRRAIAVNNQIPAPTLRFKEGEEVTIVVHNRMDVGTTIHWHGILLPWQMDGVEGVTQKAIPPGGSFSYKFTLEQSGTYWYHAHAGLQEQQGLYGALLIEPKNPSKYQYTKDYVVVLSDWTNTNPNHVLSNLKKDGDYYGPKFPLQPSLSKFIHDYHKATKNERSKILDDYKMMQQMRMSIYDLNDVAYDTFLLNGFTPQNPWTGQVKVGDVVRLRFIGAGANTIFRVKIPQTTLQMVHAQGNDVKPYNINDFTIAPGETYDILVKIKKDKPYIIYAESRDTVGAAVGALITHSKQVVPYHQVKAFPEPLPVTREMMDFMMGEMSTNTSKSMEMKHHSMPMDNSHEMNMNDGSMMMRHNSKKLLHTSMTNEPKMHSIHKGMTNSMSSMHEMGGTNSMEHMSMPIEPTRIGDTIAPSNSIYRTSLGTKYQPITAAIPTNDPNKPIAGVINMELFGYMDRFIWFINGIPEDQAHPIPLEPGKRYRVVFTNTSMMYHPMHIHGHWFILRKGAGTYDPLLHTISIPPGATITADLDTDASGQWLFHCHLLYHMMSGMSRTFQYTTLIGIVENKTKPQDIIKQTAYYNRPIVRVDEVKPIDATLVEHPMAHHTTGLWMATFLDIGADPFNNAQRLNYKGLYGFDYNKLELLVKDAELYKGTLENADLDIFYWHLISQFWAIKGGVNYFNQPSQTPYWQAGLGVEGLMPWYIDTDVRTYFHGGSIKLDVELSRDTQITNNFFIRTGVRSILATKTILKAELGSGLNQMRYMLRPYYRLMPGLNAFVEYENEQDYGAFKRIQLDNGDLSNQDTVSFGVVAIF